MCRRCDRFGEDAFEMYLRYYTDTQNSSIFEYHNFLLIFFWKVSWMRYWKLQYL